MRSRSSSPHAVRTRREEARLPAGFFVLAVGPPARLRSDPSDCEGPRVRRRRLAHYYYPTDGSWQSGGTVETMMHEIGMSGRKGALSVDGFDGSGADWLERYNPTSRTGRRPSRARTRSTGRRRTTLCCSFASTGSRGFILAGVSANLWTEGHLRGLIEAGFEVVVVADATAAAQHPQPGDGYQAALTKFRFMASGVMTTAEVVAALGYGRDSGGRSSIAPLSPVACLWQWGETLMRSVKPSDRIILI